MEFSEFDITKFSYRLIVLMEENNMTQIELARKIGISNVTISRYLSGDRIPRLDVITRIAQVFHISIDYLLGICDTKEITSESGNTDIDIALLLKKIYKLDKNSPLSKKQVDLVKNLLLGSKDFIFSA